MAGERNALCRKRLAATASRVALKRQSIVAPVESTPIQIGPLAGDPAVGLVDSPRPVRVLEFRAAARCREGVKSIL
jgi:hypothetical protein